MALVCDWLTNVGGAEKVLLEMHRLFPEAPIYTSQYDPKKIDWFADADVRTGKLQKYPVGLRRFLGPLRKRYFSKLDLSDYDLIISVTGAEAKAVKSGKRLHEKGKDVKCPNGIHISYCHVPTQYYWQMYDDYVKNPGFGILNPLVRFFFRIIIGPLRRSDLKIARVPDYYITISDYAKEQILKYYKREAAVICPPVEIDSFNIKTTKKQIKKQGKAKAKKSASVERPVENYYIATSRQVNWKRLDLAIKACEMTQRHLLIIGEGAEHDKLVKLAQGSDLVKFLPLMKKEELAKYLAKAKGYLFPSLEPFGIAPVEALACGCPVIAFTEGGSREYVVDGENGVLFEEQTAKSLAEAILRFEKMKFSPEKVRESAKKFSVKRFDREVKKFVDEKTK
ncbi:glycosyltransferase [Candidatus Saccharibacteria bacterium]|nr:glycosyltransferase [Candidatus Saccharibacteria bacterium]